MIVGIVRFAETSHKFPFVLPGNALVPEPAEIQPNSFGRRHLMRRAVFSGYPREVCGRSRQTLAPKISPIVDKSLATAYMYMVDLFPCTIGIGTPAVQVRFLEPRSDYRQSPTFRRVEGQ